MNYSFILIGCVGFLEEFIAILYYRVGAKNFKYACGILQMLRVYLWAFVITSIVKNIENSLGLVTCYAMGGALGDWLSLTCEPYLEDKILWIHKVFKKKKGRRKKRWYLLQQGKKRK